MALHDHDNIIASNGCLAIARICHVPVIADTEDRDIAFPVTHTCTNMDLYMCRCIIFPTLTPALILTFTRAAH